MLVGGCECICEDICRCVYEHTRVTLLYVNEVCAMNKKEYVLRVCVGGGWVGVGVFVSIHVGVFMNTPELHFCK